MGDQGRPQQTHAEGDGSFPPTQPAFNILGQRRPGAIAGGHLTPRPPSVTEKAIIAANRGS